MLLKHIKAFSGEFREGFDALAQLVFMTKQLNRSLLATSTILATSGKSATIQELEQAHLRLDKTRSFLDIIRRLTTTGLLHVVDAQGICIYKHILFLFRASFESSSS